MIEVFESIKESSLDEEVKMKRATSNPLIPRIYGIPRIHKEGVSLRPIVDTIGSPTYNWQYF